MEMVSVNSSNIAAIGYDQDTAVLTIQFIKGNVYEYYDVPSHEHDELMRADSKGTYANKNIYKRYRQQKIG
jgi:hypothetical protein